MSFEEAAALIRKPFKWKVCLHPEAPQGCGKIISAHTLQRSGVLSKIAENGHVYSCKEGAHYLAETGGRLVPRLLGTREASTFNGFCDKHDSKLFRPIEMGTVPIDAEAALLLTLRAIAYELYTKRAAIAADELMLTADAGRPFEEQAFFQEMIGAHLAGSRVGLADGERWKAKLDQAFLTGDHSELRMYVVEFEEALPVVATGAFFPERAMDGASLQSLMETQLDYVVLALTYSGDRSVLVLAWHAAGDGKAEAFVKSFASLPDDQKAIAAAVLSFAHIENTHLRPSWWEGLSDSDKSGVSGLMHSQGLGDLPSIDLIGPKAAFKLVSAVRSAKWL